jgi:hypothetical protein
MSLLSQFNCFFEASKHHQWRSTVDIEFNVLVKNGTWDLVPPKPSYNLVGNKRAFHIKRHADGRVERFKA